MAYINFFPGNTRDSREVTLSDDAAYGMAADLGDLIDSMRNGSAASLPADGVKDALCDGQALAAIGVTDDDQAIVEELYNSI